MSDHGKPSKVEIGQRWRLSPFYEEDGDEFAYRIIAPYPELPAGFVHVEYTDGKQGIRTPGEVLTDSDFLGWAPGFGPGSRPSTEGRPRDWSAWLPTGELPDSGPKDFVAGQIWAAHVGIAGNACVVRIRPGTDEFGNPLCTHLAMAGYWAKGKSAPHDDDIAKASPFACHAVLVADVGCEPTPPDVLYGSPAPTPVALEETRPAPVVAAKPIRRVPESCLLERWNETGPLSALEAIQAKRPPEPWRPSVDEYDLLPDAGTSWSDTRGSGRP